MSEPTSKDHAELDPKLEEWLRTAREIEREAPAVPELDALFSSVALDIEGAEKSRAFWLRSRPTWMRRLIAGGAAAAVVASGAMMLRDDFAALPAPFLAVALLSLGTLLSLSVHHALRPAHQPGMAPWAHAGVAFATLASTFALALLSPAGALAQDGGLLHGGACFVYGLLVGVPLYLVLRLLDRGPRATSLLAACAAGLAANLALTLHCPHGDLAHLMLGHFSVALLFVTGLALVSAFDR